MNIPVELIIMIISLITGAIGIIHWQKGNSLLSSGKKAIAIVYKNVYSRNGDSGTYYPVVRFLTDKKEWITQQLDIGYSPAMEEGTRIDVIYDPEEPENVQINSTFYLEILPRILVGLALCGFIFGILEVFDVLSLIE